MFDPAVFFVSAAVTVNVVAGQIQQYCGFRYEISGKFQLKTADFHHDCFQFRQFSPETADRNFRKRESDVSGGNDGEIQRVEQPRCKFSSSSLAVCAGYVNKTACEGVVGIVKDIEKRTDEKTFFALTL